MNAFTRSEAGSDAKVPKVARVWTTANGLTLLRILMIGPFLYFIARNRFVPALCIFFLASVTDFFDGYLARRYEQGTALGRILDPAADKLLTTASYVVLAIARPTGPAIPVWLALSVVARDVMILAGALLLYLVRGFKEFRPTLSSKINTLFELGLVVFFLLFHSLGAFTAVLLPLYWLVLATVLISGTEYLVRGAKILLRQRPLEQP